MRSSALKTALVFVLIFATTLSQIAPSLARADENRWRVAFIGIKFENLPQDIQDIVSWRLAQLLETQDIFLLSKPDSLRIQYGQERIAELAGNQDPAAFFEFGRQFRFDFIFSGTLANQSSDNYGIFLVGNLNRYDVATGQVNSYSLKVKYDELGNELLQFKQAYIDSLPTARDSGKKIWSKLFIAGVIVGAAVLFRSLAGSAKGGEESQRDRNPGDN